uniref:Uncharacterized protein n=1 Tax=Arundo donax TaxID=35708 RepID=A0A0A8Y296_ARUDO
MKRALVTSTPIYGLQRKVFISFVTRG